MISENCFLREIYNVHVISIFMSLPPTITSRLKEETFLVSNLPDRDIISP